MVQSDERGVILVAVILLMSVLALLGTTAMITTRTTFKISGNYRSGQEALYVAQGGAEYGLNRLRAALNVPGGNTGSVVPPTITGYTFEDADSFLALSGSVVQKTVTGQFAGLTGYCQKYVITSSVQKNNSNARAIVMYEVEAQEIPVFQFGVFYHSDLEILPGGNMTFTGNPIHSNGDIYLYPSGTVNIDSVLTSAGRILRTRKDTNSTTFGSVNIKNADGNYQSLTMDSSNSSWRADARERWGGRVKSAAHDIQFLNQPLPSGGNTIDILGTGPVSLYRKSGLRIINGEAYDKNGTWVNLTLGGNNPISVNYNILYDGRQATWMDIVQVDVNLLRNNTVAMSKLNDPPAGGEARILYVSTTSGYMSDPAVRLINGGTIPAGGFSVVTDKPLYIQGNYNTGNLSAGIFADALTVLSGNWNDYYSGWSIYYRVASSTTINAAIMAGIKYTAGNQYSGGVENFIRLLENWSGRSLTFNGSLVCQWQSQYATGNWPSIGTVYNPPTRIWSYTTSLADLPPGTPRVITVQRMGCSQVLN